MSVFTSSDELVDQVAAFVGDFAASDAGRNAAERATALSADLTLSLATREPHTTLWIDFARGEVAPAAAGEAAASVEIDADDLHHLMMDQLGPVEISRLSETDRLQVSGKPEALAALVLIAAQAQPFYPGSLHRRERHDLLGTAPPPTRTVWGVDGPPPPLIETRRPWQRAKPAAAG